MSGLPNVNIGLAQGALGQTTATNDQVSGFIMGSTVAGSEIPFDTAKQIFSLQDAVDLGLNSEYDSDNSVYVYGQLKDFYAEAPGAECWIMLFNSASDDKNSVLTPIGSSKAEILLDAANGEIKRLAVSGHSGEDSEVYVADPESFGGIDPKAIDSLTTGQALAEEYADRNQPFRLVIEGSGYTGTVADLYNYKGSSGTAYNRCAIVIGATAANSACVGLAMGRKAANPVQRNIGRVKDGGLNTTTTAMLSDGTTVESIQPSELDNLHNKGYIFMRTYSGKSGYFFNDDSMATSASDDYSFWARGEVIDKAQRIAYGVYINELLDEIPIDSDGKVAPALTGHWEALIENAINQQMTANGEISSVRAVIDPEQNVLSTNKVEVELYVTPVGYAKEINVTLGFENPALNNA